MNQNNFRYYVIRSKFLYRGINLLYLYRLKKDHFSNRSLYHSNLKKKELVDCL